MKTGWKIPVFLLLLAGGLFAGCLLWVSRADARLPAGASVGVLPVGGMTLAEVETALQNGQDLYDQTPLQAAQIPRKIYKPSEWGLTLDVSRTYEAVREAWNRVNPVERLFGSPQIQVRPVWHLNETVFEKRLRSLRFLEKSAADAKVIWKNGRIVLQPEVVGRKIDPARTRENLLEAALTLSGRSAQQIVSRDSTMPDNRLVFELAFVTSPPRITRDQLKSVRGVVASYTTNFPGYQTDRNSNIRLAADALNGKILMPGEKLSYNEVVGKRSRKKGFKLAPVIVKGEKRLGVGGGICQVSSTLFNAALLADMKIVRRHNHSIPIAYVPRGRDATVTDSGLDLVIANNQRTPLVISTEVRRSSMVVRVLGAPERDKRVVVQTQWLGSAGAPVRYEDASHLPAGTQKVVKSGSSGSRVRTLRLVYEGQRLVRQEVIATSVYRAQPRVIARGAKKAVSKHDSSGSSLVAPESHPEAVD